MAFAAETAPDAILQLLRGWSFIGATDEPEPSGENESGQQKFHPASLKARPLFARRGLRWTRASCAEGV